MTQPIYLVGGGKGGVGKSMLSMALLDHLRCPPLLPLLDEPVGRQRLTPEIGDHLGLEDDLGTLGRDGDVDALLGKAGAEGERVAVGRLEHGG